MLWCSGNNSNGRLGVGDVIEHNVAVRVGGAAEPSRA